MVTDAIQEVIIPPSGSAVTQSETPHGNLRSVLHPNPDHPAAQIAWRYDELRFVWVLVMGEHAVALSAKLLEWQWTNFAELTNGRDTYSDRLQSFLQGEARQVGSDDSPHSIVVGLMDRQVQDGDLVVGWLGSSAIRLYNVQRDTYTIDVGIQAGEGWSCQKGVYPETTRPHVQHYTLNDIDRLLIFTNTLRKVIDEIPLVGRNTLQRIAEAESANGTVALLDIHPRQIVTQPGEIHLNYRWETPTQVTLSWSGGEEATAFHIEEAPSPDFHTIKTIAELTDHRQRVYTVTPPQDREVYYRVMPLNHDMRGIASVPVIVTPVPLMPPQIESVQWVASGNIRVEWGAIPQADIYELEFSPGQDFDSAQTSIVYKGESTVYEIEIDEPPAGWYFRVRSRNSHFMPKFASIWSNPKRAPLRLQTPTFKTVSPALISWTPSDGASGYQIRQKTASHEKVLAFTDRPRFNPPPDVEAIYEVRAIRAEDDEKTASDWSSPITIGVSSSDLPIIPETDDDNDTVPLTILHEKPEVANGKRNLLFLGVVSLITLFLGVMGGLIGGTSLGIGVEPTATPISDLDEQATLTQQLLNQENAVQRVTLSSELSRMNIAATENANQIHLLQTRNANLNNQNEDMAIDQSTLNANLDTMDSTNVYLEAVSTNSALVQVTLNAETTALAETLLALTPTPTRTPTPTLTPSQTPTPEPIFGKITLPRLW